MEISVIVCSKNRAEQLRITLQKWLEIDLTGLTEMVVVDNNSTDGTKKIIDEFSESAPFNVVYVLERKSGLSNARNAGLRLVKADLVVFGDDDCYPEFKYLPFLQRAFSEDPEIAYVGGRVELFDPQDLPITIQTRSTALVIPPYSVLKAGVIHGANFAVRSSSIVDAGEFDTRLGAGTSICSGEDIDYLARMSWQGMKGIYDPRPVVYHHHGRRLWSDGRKLQKGYALGRGAYYLKFMLRRNSRKAYTRFWLSEWRREIDWQRLLELAGMFKYSRQSLINQVSKIRSFGSS